MKKLCLVSVLIVLVLISGCSNKNITQTKTVSPPEKYSVNLDVAFRNIKMTALMTKLSPKKVEIQILSPEIMTPLSLLYENGVCTVTYDGLKFETDLNRFPQVAFGALLTESIANIREGIDIQTTYADGIWTYKGTGERGIFVLTRDAETGAWLELSIEGAQLQVVFSEFKHI